MILKIKYKTLAILMVVLIVFIFAIPFYVNIRDVIATSTSPSVRVPIVMYHQILKDSKRWGKYVISPEDFEKDLVYLKNKGYTTIVIQDLINYVYDKKPLPEKPVMITLDDGYLSNYTYVLPILEKQNCKAVISIVGEFTDRFTDNPDENMAYSHFNWAQVKALVDSPYVEIQNHSYNMHQIGERKGSSKRKGESSEEYKKILKADLEKLQKLMKENTEYVPNAYTYPYGAISKDSMEVLKELGFLASMSCGQGVNILTGSKEELYGLKRYNRPYGINRDKFFGQFEK